MYQVNIYELRDLPNGDQEERLVRTVSEHDEWSSAVSAYQELMPEYDTENDQYASIYDTQNDIQTQL